MRKRNLVASIVWCLCSLVTSAAYADVYNVTTYGATGNDATIDTTAFVNAIAAVPAAGGEIYVPAGRYRIDATLNIVNKHISFRGEGAKQSVIEWVTSGIDGIVFAPNIAPPNDIIHANDTIRVVGLTLLNASLSPWTGVALKMTWPAMPGGHTGHDYWSAVVDQVYITGWQGHIELENATHTKISNFSFTGASTTNSIVLKGLIVPIYITKGDIWGGDTGIKAYGSPTKPAYHTAEGIHITDLEIGSVNVGIDLDYVVGTSVAGNHVNAGRVGIACSGCVHVAITGNSIMGTAGEGTNVATWDFMGIYITGGTDESYNLRITSNDIVAANTGPAGGGNAVVARGIFVNAPGMTNSVISNNTAGWVGYGLQLWAGTCDTSVTGNNMKKNIYASSYVIPTNTPTCSNMVANNWP